MKGGLEMKYFFQMVLILLYDFEEFEEESTP